MSRPKFLALALVFAVFCGVQPSAQAGVAGDWELTFTSAQGGSSAVAVAFKQDGDTITAELVSPFGSAKLSGAETGGNLKMTGSVAIQDLALDLALSATLAGETLNGTVTFGTLGDFPFTGKRPEKKSTDAPRPAEADASAAGAANISGAWTIALQIANFGAFPVTATFDQNGEKVTGTLASPLGPLTAIGTMAGNTLQVECVALTPQGSFTITMNGQLGPNGFTGKASMPGFGEADWTGVRAP